MTEQKKNIKRISKNAYYKPFLEKANAAKEKQKMELALERAWHNRDFEIDKYWSRATYFWAFIAATFAGYIAVMASNKMQPEFQNELAFAIICMGVIFSTSWVLVNIGSKKWQENWEKHIDMLEDSVTGPIYKTVWNKTAYSVSTINIYVSRFVTSIWGLLAIAQAFGLPYKSYIHFYNRPIDWPIVITCLLTVCFLALLYLKTRRPFLRNEADNSDKFSFERRAIHFEGPTEDQIEL